MKAAEKVHNTNFTGEEVKDDQEEEAMKTPNYMYAEHTSKTLVRVEADAFNVWFADRYQDGWSIVSEQKANDMLDLWDEVWDYPITYDCGRLAGITAQFSIDATWYREHRSF